MTYQQLLKDPRWNAKRLEILKRDNWTCQYCYTTHTEMHVHHMFYDFDLNPWEYDGWALLTLCSSCHEDEEFHKNFTNHGIKYLSELGFLHKDLADIIAIASKRLINEDETSEKRAYIERIKSDMRHG